MIYTAFGWTYKLFQNNFPYTYVLFHMKYNVALEQECGE